MNVIVPALPKRLALTDGMIEDFVWDPVLAAGFLLGRKYDIFQKARLRFHWFFPMLIDSSGASSGKTIEDWDYIQLRSIIFSGHRSGVFYPSFETMKGSFFEYYTSTTSPIFHAHLGRLDETGEEEGKNRVRGSGCYMAYYRNGSEVRMPAPSHVKDSPNEASMRYNTVLVEEWTHVEAMGNSIDAQLRFRATKPNFNADHPVRCNHFHLTAPAKTMMHPAYPRYADYEKKARSGNVKYGVVTFNYKYYSNEKMASGETFADACRRPAEDAANDLKKDRTHYLSEGLGIWARNTKGWFSEEAIARAQSIGRELGMMPFSNRREMEEALTRIE